MTSRGWQIAGGLAILFLCVAWICARQCDFGSSTSHDDSDGPWTCDSTEDVDTGSPDDQSKVAEPTDPTAGLEDPFELRVRNLVAAYAQELAVRRTRIWDPDFEMYITTPEGYWGARSELVSLASAGTPHLDRLLIEAFYRYRSQKTRAALINLLGFQELRGGVVRAFLLRTVSDERDERLTEVGIMALLFNQMRGRTHGPGDLPGRYGSPVFTQEYYDTAGVFVPRHSWTLPARFYVDAQDIDPEVMSCIAKRMVPSSADYVHEVVLGLVKGCRGQPEYAAALANLLPHVCGEVRTRLVESLWQSDDPAMLLLAQEHSRVMENVRLSTMPGCTSAKQSPSAPFRGTTQVARISVTDASGAFALAVTLEISHDAGLTWRSAGCASTSVLGTSELTVVIDAGKRSRHWRLRAEVSGTNVSATFTVSMNWS